jgi:K+-transporting ATPase c subunit
MYESIINAPKKDEKGYFYTRGRMTRQATAEEIARGAGTKTYVNLDKGKLIGEVWSEPKFYQPRGKERLGCPHKNQESADLNFARSSNMTANTATEIYRKRYTFQKIT